VARASGRRRDGEPQRVHGALSIVVASALWAAGSLYSRRAPRARHPLLPVAMQMLSGSGALLVAATVEGEWSRVDLGAITARSALALAYLTVFGSLAAFSTYVWLLRASAPAKVSTYAYVNPVVAVFLGWLLAGETVEAGTLGAAAVIVTSVVLITAERRRAAIPPPDLPADHVADVRPSSSRTALKRSHSR
jgi:drug/metabolite transporter (DMT)-like permease